MSNYFAVVTFRVADLTRSQPRVTTSRCPDLVTSRCRDITSGDHGITSFIWSGSRRVGWGVGARGPDTVTVCSVTALAGGSALATRFVIELGGRGRWRVGRCGGALATRLIIELGTAMAGRKVRMTGRSVTALAGRKVRRRARNTIDH